MSINKCHFVGNLTRDPEVMSTKGGTTVMRFGLAVNDSVKDGDEWKERPNYLDMVMFGRRAEAVSNYLSKGDKVSIECRARWSSWEDSETGKKRSKVEFTVDEIEFMSRRDGGCQRPVQQAPQQSAALAWSAQQAYRQPPAQTKPHQTYDPPVYDEDIPF